MRKGLKKVPRKESSRYPIGKAQPKSLYNQSFQLDQLYKKAPFGLCVVDRDLRYVHVNERLAAINGKPIEEHIGRRITELNPRLAAKIEPIYKKVLETGKPVFDAEFQDMNLTELNGRKYQLLTSYPLRANDETVQGVTTVIHDVIEPKQVKQEKEKGLHFEMLLCEISARFVNLPAREVDGEIEWALKRIVEFLGVHRGSVIQFSKEKKLYISHAYAAPGFKPIEKMVMNEQFPWSTLKLLRGEIQRISDLGDWPEEARQEKLYCQRIGLSSVFGIPLKVGGSLLGAVAFASFFKKRRYSDSQVQRLCLVGEIFANALMRKRADEELQSAFSEIKRLKDQLQAENIYLKKEFEVKYKYERILGHSDAIQNILRQAEQVAKTDSTVLILGETGTGKELVARAIHDLSSRKGKPTVKVNCAALPPALIESELFGREKGAYTGALTKQVGRFEVAHGSTILLDEISELSLELQAKLLRVLQEGQFERLGSSKTIHVDVRVIATTNRDLAKAVREGHFREDLYYRLNIFPISVPPLRERREDIPELVWFFVREFSETMRKSIERIPRKSMEILQRYSWPGNVRELRNVIERSMILSKGSTLEVILPKIDETSNLDGITLKQLERKHILNVLDKTGWRIKGKSGAAEILGLKPSTLFFKMKKLGIYRHNSLDSILSKGQNTDL